MANNHEFQPARPRGTDHAEVVQVIKTKALAGRGTEDDPCREIVQYWDFDGNMLAKIDPGAESAGLCL